jgi:spermidine synthase
LKKWTLVDQTSTPDGNTMSLFEHDGAYVIRVGSEELMSTRRHVSEERIAELVCGRLESKRRASVLIGGLGMGFTLKAALAALARDAQVVVAEIVPAVIAWNRNPAYPLGATAMADQRVTILQQDVIDVISAAPFAFDGIILDIDNGPAAMTTQTNARLYKEFGLRLTRTALKRGGGVAFWSAAPDAAFEKLLARTGFKVEAHRSPGSSHTIFVAR